MNNVIATTNLRLLSLSNELRYEIYLSQLDTDSQASIVIYSCWILGKRQSLIADVKWMMNRHWMEDKRKRTIENLTYVFLNSPLWETKKSINNLINKFKLFFFSFAIAFVWTICRVVFGGFLFGVCVLISLFSRLPVRTIKFKLCGNFERFRQMYSRRDRYCYVFYLCSSFTFLNCIVYQFTCFIHHIKYKFECVHATINRSICTGIVSTSTSTQCARVSISIPCGVPLYCKSTHFDKILLLLLLFFHKNIR